MRFLLVKCLTNRSPRISAGRAAALLAALMAIGAGVEAARCAELADAGIVRKLDGRVTAAWSGQSLGAALKRLSFSQDLPFWIDRRVDISAAVELSANDVPVREVLAQLGAPRELAAVAFRSVVYFGPRQTADELATLSVRARDSLAKAPPDVRARWLKSAGWSYPRLSQPRALVGDLVRSVGAEVVDDERIAFDLWPGRAAPAMPVVDRVVLVLAGFDLAAEISADGRNLRVVQIARPVEITREYSVPRKRREAFNSALSGMASDKIKQRGARAEVSARWEDHELLRAAIRGTTAAPAAPRAAKQTPQGGKKSSQTFTLKIENQPVDRVIDQFARQLNLTVEWTGKRPEGVAALVSCDVREVNLDGLLKAVLTPAHLTFERQGDHVAIRPAP